MTDSMSTDIWARWTLTGGNWNYTEIPAHYPKGLNTHTLISSASLSCCVSEYLQAVQASSVLAGVFQLLACTWLCIMIAASIYTDIFHKDKDPGWYGTSFILAWISVSIFPLGCRVCCSARPSPYGSVQSILRGDAGVPHIVLQTVEPSLLGPSAWSLAVRA
uniref:Uncharacterized protein n=1 Tax=Sinocyclocheilus anshuiensis TaxID=1608454 RepID=A0A671QVZ7_9TELE